MKKLLFISHENTRTGAPMVLLYFMQWLKQHQPEVCVDFLTLNEGDLSEDFKQVCHEYYNLIIPYKRKTLFQRVINKIIKSKLQKSKKQPVIEKLSNTNYDLIYANSVAAAQTGFLIKNNSKTPLVVHVHELKTIITSFNLPKEVIDSIDHTIAVSELVKSNLLKQWQLAENKISVVYECSKINSNHLKKQKKASFIVGSSGHVHWRKSPDVFLQVARTLFKLAPNLDVQFQWVGGLAENERVILESDIEKLGLQNKVHFLGQTASPINYFQHFDVFLMPSREDPFPLVCIEVASLGVPIIAFEKATGTAEILRKGGGKIVPYLDIEAMANSVLFYYNNPEHCIADGKKAKELFSEFTPENICPQLFAVCNKFLNP
jgi:glycosyltransferase involved in cell wall biosynthesis